MTLKKLSLLLAGIALMSVSAFAAGQSDSAGSEGSAAEKTTITFGYAGGDPLVKQLTNERVMKFMEENPQYNIIQMPSGSGAYLEFLKTKDAVGEFPDMLDSRDTAVWVRADKLAELPESVKSLVKEAPQLDGKYYIAPISIIPAAGGTYYNKALFDELGLKEPKTYDEFLSNLETIKNSGTAPIVVGGKDGWHMGFTWGHYWVNNVASKNPNWIADRYRGKVSFSDPDMKESFTQYAELWEKGYVEKGFLSTGDNQIASFLVTGKAAMFISGTWMIQQIMDADPEFEFGWAPIPDEDGTLKLMFGPKLQGWALSKEAAADPKKVEAFEAFMKFWYDPENYTEYLQKTNMFSAAAAQIDVKYESNILSEVNEAMNASVFNAGNWNTNWGENELPGSFRNFAYKAFQEFVSSDITVDEFTAKLDKEWEVEAAQFNPTK
ncbi:MAG: ABC transporter substrate-binding protein [Spirochaetales bacterium]|nr:ABC transporter substrate-binding protein [Spirochaetales bacterium]